MKNVKRHRPPAKIKNKIIIIDNNIHTPMTNPMEHVFLAALLLFF